MVGEPIRVRASRKRKFLNVFTFYTWHALLSCHTDA